MITLGATNTLGGSAGTATAVTYTVTGMELASGVETYKVLAQGQLPTSAAALYTVPGSTVAFIREILLANVSAVTVNVTLFVNGLVAANQICSFPIPPNGEATFDGSGWKVYDTYGGLVSAPQVVDSTAVHIQGAETITGLKTFSVTTPGSLVLGGKVTSHAANMAELYPSGLWLGTGASSGAVDTGIDRDQGNGDLIIWTANTPRMRFSQAGGVSIDEGVNVALGATTGTKIGTASSQKLGFFNAAPVVQRGAPSTLQSVITALSDLGLAAAGTAALANADVAAAAAILPSKLLSGTFQYNVWAPYNTSTIATGATWYLLAGGGAGTEKTTLTVKAYSLAIAFFVPTLYNNTTAGTVVNLRFNATISAGGPLSLPTNFTTGVTTAIGVYTTCPIIGIWLVPWTSGTPTLSIAVEFQSSNAGSYINSGLTYGGVLLVPYV